MTKCFVIMPISMPDIYADRYNDPEHFQHVLDCLFTPALEAAGYEIVPPTVEGSDLIHAEIISNLETCDLVLCDISTSNPNVFFELGIRTSLDRPVALVRDNFTIQIPFDTGSINTYTYDASLQAWTLPSEEEKLTSHIQQAAAKSGNRNALWRYFGLTQRASPAEISDPTQGKLDLLIDEITQLKKRLDIVPNPLAPTSFSRENSLLAERSGLRRVVSRYETGVVEALKSMGYGVRPGIRDTAFGSFDAFDFLVEDTSGQIILAVLKYLPTPLSSEIVAPIIHQASRTTAPVLLITFSELSDEAREDVNRPRRFEAVQWRGEKDNSRLAEALRRMFASILDSRRTATDDQPQ